MNKRGRFYIIKDGATYIFYSQQAAARWQYKYGGEIRDKLKPL